jgi:hypothetical protein
MKTNNTDREIIDARIFAHLKHKLSPDYKLVTIRTKWLGQRNKTDYYRVRYFVTSTRFTGGVRYDNVAVREKEVSVVFDDDWK